MTPKEANDSLKAIIQSHIVHLQSGKFGTPTQQDLEFCGELHELLENKTKENETVDMG